MLVDTHTHQYYTPEDFLERVEVIKRAIDNGVEKMLFPNVDIQTIDSLFDTAKHFPENCFPMLGLHPCSVDQDYKKNLDIIYSKISQNKIYGIGEIGIDLYWDKSFISEQKDAFTQQVRWAKDLKLPISIHLRSAFDEVYEIISKEKNDYLTGVFHCFSGTIEQAKLATEMGFMLGIGGVVTYKNAGIDKIVSEVSLDNIVLETDAPYLPPVPHRGKQNESSYLVYVAQKIADIHQVSVEEVALRTTNNAKKIFDLC